VGCVRVLKEPHGVTEIKGDRAESGGRTDRKKDKTLNGGGPIGQQPSKPHTTNARKRREPLKASKKGTPKKAEVKNRGMEMTSQEQFARVQRGNCGQRRSTTLQTGATRNTSLWSQRGGPGGLGRCSG